MRGWYEVEKKHSSSKEEEKKRKKRKKKKPQQNQNNGAAFPPSSFLPPSLFQDEDDQDSSDQLLFHNHREEPDIERGLFQSKENRDAKDPAMFIRQLTPTPCDGCVYIGFPLAFLILNSIAALWSYQGRQQGLLAREMCYQQPLDIYLLAVAIHGLLNVLVLLPYLALRFAELRIRAKLASKASFELALMKAQMYTPYFESTDSNCIVFLEAFLLLNAFVQVGLGLLSEAWIGYMGIASPSINGCAVSAPILFTTTKYLGLYENWILLPLLSALIRIVCV
mmetsp:Transcript_43550/g.85263  ORF Transcript_43550/g.85263 Transcript_43550/m.85263 type:complete len:280 (+) Transcript_43550:41-880(+)|eukprot:CAMPEP_0175121626 /NCGR_PEP_ID=MMETSP0087-20121206/1272_1 /TAXON_ID=136419 /ORGANISM="Unknown Unknown, Strain D1" /LENGTH=279 /DNA_ID=CAMNT_0016403187 /DNA_START=33 /DNA_END=872 /DNA_ORIENTATION=-